ncbi:MAG: NAD(+) synthase [Oscillospiraceae bacterium]|nr:NAD(+) synthase [Oscillospiraceae bacterium]
MRDYAKETEKRVAFIKRILEESGAKGIVYGNSGGKDSALVGILCKLACENAVGIMMPCESKRNFGEDMADAREAAEKYHIETRVVDLTAAKKAIVEAVGAVAGLNSAALNNIAPRLRMTTLYAIGAAENRLVAGTGNRSEAYMGYFTKFGDGAYDFNAISDLTVTEIYELLRYLGAPDNIITKAPSAGLFEGQTDEMEMGVTYKAIDEYLLNGTVTPQNRAIIDKFHSRSEHKRCMPKTYPADAE